MKEMNSTVLTARDLVLYKGDRPVTLEVTDGVTVIQTVRESASTSLAMALAGRFRPHSGTIDGPGFKRTALAGVPLLDSLERQVSVREVLREQVAWAQPFFSWTPKDIMRHKYVARWLAPLQLQGLDAEQPVGELNVLERFRLRILLALVSRPYAELLIVDDIDQIKDMDLRQELLGDLVSVATHVPVVFTTVNEEL